MNYIAAGPKLIGDEQPNDGYGKTMRGKERGKK